MSGFFVQILLLVVTFHSTCWKVANKPLVPTAGVGSTVTRTVQRDHRLRRDWGRVGSSPAGVGSVPHCPHQASPGKPQRFSWRGVLTARCEQGLFKISESRTHAAAGEAFDSQVHESPIVCAALCSSGWHYCWLC